MHVSSSSFPASTGPASELSEEELDQQRLIDEITGQMTLF
jgi:hypothetical protein